MANYELKPRLNRLDGVATVIVQGGQEPEFQITPDPAKLLAASVTVTDILDAVRRTNLIDSPGLLEQNHQLYLGLVNGQVKDPEQLGQIVIKATPAGVPVRIADVARVGPGVKPVYTVVTANGKPAVLLNVSRQPDSNTVASRRRSSRRSRPHPPVAAAGHQAAAFLRPVGDRHRVHQERARCDSDRPRAGLAHHGAVPARLGCVDRRRAGHPGDRAGDLHRSQGAGPELQPDDARRPGSRRRPGDRRCHRGG